MLACVLCFVFSGLLAVAYAVINKKPETKAALMSDAMVKEFRDAQKLRDKGITYNNVYSTQIGFDSRTIIQTLPVGASTCNATCKGTPTCSGFQMHPGDTTCDLLNSNISATYGFLNNGWNFFQLQDFTPTKIFGITVPGQEPGSGPEQIGGLLPGETKETCARYCQSNTSCTAMSISPAGCKLWKDGYTAYPVPTANIYKLSDVSYSVASFPGTPA